jgi:hypothetical protein
MGIAYGTTTLHQATKGIVQDGLVLNLDAGVRDSYDGGTTWRDLKGGNDGSLMNGPTFDKTNGGNIVLDGTNQYIDLGSSAPVTSKLAGSDSVSCCFWYKRNASENNSGIIGIGSNLNRQIWVYDTTAYGVQLSVDNTSSVQTGVKENSVQSTGVWFHYSLTWTAGSAKIYRNGTLVNTDSNPTGTIYSAQSTNYLGYIAGFGYNEIDLGQVIIYNKVLTAAEVLQNFNATRHRFGI